MVPVLEIVFWTVCKFLLAGFGILYAGLVLMAYRTEGGDGYRLHLVRRAPFHSAAQLLVRLGAKAVEVIVRAGRAALDILSEASADVGEWCVRRRGGDVEAIFHSHFL